MKKTAILIIVFFLSINITSAKETSNSQIQQEITTIFSNYEQQLTNVEMEKEENLFYNNKRTLEKAVKEIQPLIKELNNNFSEKEETKALISKFNNLQKTLERYNKKNEEIQNIDISIDKKIDSLRKDPNKNNLKEIKIGDIVKIKGKLRNPTTASNPYQFNYAKYLKRKGVFSTFYGDENCLKLISEPNFTISNFTYKILHELDKTREKIIVNHAKYI